jgi:hypothetical protein
VTYTGDYTKIIFSQKLTGVGYTGESVLTGVGYTGESGLTGVGFRPANSLKGTIP